MRTPVLASVLVAALFLLTALTGLHPYSAPNKPSASSASPYELTPNAYNAALTLAGINPQEYTSASVWWHGLTAAQQQAALAAYREIPVTHKFPVELAHQLGLVQAQFNYYCLGASIVAGGAVGGIVGNVPGAIIGAIAGGVVGYFGCQDSAAALSSAFVLWSQALINSYANEGNLTQVSFQNIISALNLTKPGWERAADHAALLQLGNSSFNTSLDLMQSGIFANLAPVWTALAYEEAAIFNALLPPINGFCTAGALFASKNCALAVNSGGGNLGPSTSTGGIVGYGALFDGSGSPSATNVWIPNGANISTRAGDTITIKNLLNGLSYNYAPVTGCPGAATAWCSEIFPGPSGLYTVADTVGLTFWIANGQVAPSSATSTFDCSGSGFGVGCVGFNQATDDGFAVFEPNTVYTGCTGPDMRGTAGRSTTTAGATVCETANVAIAGTGAYGYTTNNLNNNQWKSLQPQLSAIEWDAVQNAQVYWQFLRAIGYTSISQIPPNCIVPAPYLVLPSNLQGVALNVSQWMSLYLATLQGLAVFYNTSLTSATFCGTQSTHQFKIGSEIWGNLFVNATGFVYLNNGTSPINVQGQALPTESFKNTSTWAVGATTPCSIGFVVSHPGNISANTCAGPEQLFLMPTLGTINVPVGVKWAVPANNPIQIYAIQAGIEFLATGNGTGTGTCTTGQGGFCSQAQLAAAALPPGASIYLTSCTVGGSASSNCTVTVQTLNVTVAQISCLTPGTGGCSQGGSGGEFGLPNPFQALASLFCKIPLLGAICGGSTALATLVIEAIFAVVIVLAIIASLAYGGRKALGAGKAR